MVRRRISAVVVALLVFTAGCGGGGGSATQQAVVETISAEEAAALLAAPPAGLVILDVRTPDEFAAGHLAGAVNLDFHAATFAGDLAALDRQVPYVLYCRTGNRSGRVLEMMRSLGFAQVHEIGGGITSWVEAGLPVAVP